jgi:hypothetical protein
MKTPITNLGDFAALDPFFRIIEQGLDGLAGPGHFFDLLAEDAVFELRATRGRPRPGMTPVEVSYALGCGHDSYVSRPPCPQRAGIAHAQPRHWERDS